MRRGAPCPIARRGPQEGGEAQPDVPGQGDRDPDGGVLTAILHALGKHAWVPLEWGQAAPPKPESPNVALPLPWVIG